MSVNLTAEVIGGYTASNVTSFNCSYGRQSKTDTFSTLNAQLTIRYAGLPAQWVLGAQVIVEIDGYVVCRGYITNIDYNYDFVTAGDSYTVSLEGYLSFFGRTVLTNFTFTNQLTGTAANTIASAISGTGKSITAIQTRSYTDTSTYSGASQNLITALVSMEQGRLDDQGNVLKFLGRDYTYADFSEPPYVDTFTFYFADDDTENYVKYDNIRFSSLSNNYFTYIQIEPAQFATQTAGSGNRTLTLDTYDTSATQADNLADYCLAEFDQSTSAPVEISTRSSLGGNAILPTFFTARVGARTQIIFRGTEYYGVVEGYNISATPSDVRYTLYMSGFEQNNFFRLDDPVYGRLDYNNLNF